MRLVIWVLSAHPHRYARALASDARRALATLADRVLGARCGRCRTRVFPADMRTHEDTQHAGDA